MKQLLTLNEGQVNEMDDLNNRDDVKAAPEEEAIEDLASENNPENLWGQLVNPDYQIPEEGMDLRGTLREVERWILSQALTITGGNRKKAARLLRLKRTTLVEKIKRLKPEIKG